MTRGVIVLCFRVTENSGASVLCFRVRIVMMGVIVMCFRVRTENSDDRCYCSVF